MKFRNIIFLMLLAAIVLAVPSSEELHLLASKAKPSITIVVDAGHGGPDGGAEGADGTCEADLNLAIAKAVKEEGVRRGIEIVLTREDKEGLYSEENMERKWRKLEDMQCRKAYIANSKAHVAVSIHMNSFPSDTNVRGAQVFYPKSGNAEIIAASERLAKSVQAALVSGLDDGSNRIAMPREEVYLMENPAVPMILVECGFLSNPSDLARLKQEKWQYSIAECILDGLLSSEEI